MGTHSIFTERQWDWVRDRFCEGYSAAALARFLGVGLSTVYQHVECRKELPPLDGREKEFNALREE